MNTHPWMSYSRSRCIFQWTKLYQQITFYGFAGDHQSTEDRPMTTHRLLVLDFHNCIKTTIISSWTRMTDSPWIWIQGLIWFTPPNRTAGSVHHRDGTWRTTANSRSRRRNKYPGRWCLFVCRTSQSTQRWRPRSRVKGAVFRARASGTTWVCIPASVL